MTMSVDEIISTTPTPPNHGPWIAGDAPKGADRATVLVCQERDRVIAHAFRLEQVDPLQLEIGHDALRCLDSNGSRLRANDPGDGGLMLTIRPTLNGRAGTTAYYFMTPEQLGAFKSWLANGMKGGDA